MILKHAALTVIVGVGLGLLVWQHRPVAWTTMQSLGICLLAPGFILWTIARFQLGGSFSVTAKATELVTSGLYSRIRNPIYVFGSCVFVGVILTLGRPAWLLIFLVIIPLQIWRSRKEASVLEAKFGDEHRKYRAATWF